MLNEALVYCAMGGLTFLVIVGTILLSPRVALVVIVLASALLLTGVTGFSALRGTPKSRLQRTLAP